MAEVDRRHVNFLWASPDKEDAGMLGLRRLSWCAPRGLHCASARGSGPSNHGAPAVTSPLRMPSASLPEQLEALNSLATSFSRLALAKRLSRPSSRSLSHQAFLAPGLACRIGPQQKFTMLSAPAEAWKARGQQT